MSVPQPGAATPKVYVLLLNWRNWPVTVHCLESLLRQDYPRFQVILCDNASGDGSVERIREWAAGSLPVPSDGSPPPGVSAGPPVPKPVRVVEHDRRAAEAGGGAADAEARLILVNTGANDGFAAGNNVGLRYALARGDAAYVWVLNNDTVVAPSALAEMVAVAEADTGVGMVGCKLKYYTRPTVMQAAGGGRWVPWSGLTHLWGEGEPDAGQWDRPLAPDYVHGASLLVRERLCREVGLLDERYFMYAEELDWAVRARAAGWRTAYAPKAVVWHKESQTVGWKSALQEYHAVRSALLVVRKFHPRLFPLMLVYSVYRMLLPKVVRMQPQRMRTVLRAYRDVFAEARP